MPLAQYLGRGTLGIGNYSFFFGGIRPELRNSDFPQLWNWVTELAIFGIAPFAALIFNILVIREIRSITSRGPAIIGGGGHHHHQGRGRPSVSSAWGSHNQASTMMLLTVSFYLICTWLPATLVYSLEREFPMDPGFSMNSQVIMSPVWKRHFTYITVRKCVEEVTLSNSACYFFIYCLTGKYFRDRFKMLVCPKRCVRTSMSNGTDYPLSQAANGRNSIAEPHHKEYIPLACKDNGHTKYNTEITNV